MKKTFAVVLIFCCWGKLRAEQPGQRIDIPGLPATPQAQEKRILPPAKAASEYSKLCRNQNVIGFWKVIKWTAYFQIQSKDWKKPSFMKFQWYVFSEDGQIKTLSAGKDLKIAAVEKELAGSKTPLRFQIEKKGMMKVTSIEKKEVNELWRCVLVTKNITEKTLGIELKKGDLLQTLIGTNNKILYVRQMRKIAPKGK